MYHIKVDESNWKENKDVSEQVSGCTIRVQKCEIKRGLGRKDGLVEECEKRVRGRGECRE